MLHLFLGRVKWRMRELWLWLYTSPPSLSLNNDPELTLMRNRRPRAYNENGNPRIMYVIIGHFTNKKSPMQVMATHFHAVFSLRRTAAGIGANNFPETKKKFKKLLLLMNGTFRKAWANTFGRAGAAVVRSNDRHRNFNVVIMRARFLSNIWPYTFLSTFFPRTTWMTVNPRAVPVN